MEQLFYKPYSRKRNKFSLFIISLKRNALSIIFCIFTICLVIFSNSNLQATKNGLKLWANNVLPSLFPFLIATNLLKSTNIINHISKYCNKFMRPLFNVPGNCAYAFVLGLISGYPVGAKIVADLKNNNMCTQEEAERMIAFTNNSGPLFIIGTVGMTMFSSSEIGILLLVTHILSAITVGIILGISSRIGNNHICNNRIGRFAKMPNTEYTFTHSALAHSTSVRSTSTYSDFIHSTVSTYEKNSSPFSSSINNTSCNFQNLGEILSKSILEASKTVIMIGGFVVLFSVVISICNNSKILDIAAILIQPICNILNFPLKFIKPLLFGLLELTNGISLVASTPNKAISVNIVLSAFLLGFGGISVMLQVLSITSKANIPIKKYIYGKLMQGIIATIYTYTLLTVFPIFNLNL